MPRKPSYHSHSPRRIDSDDGPTDTHAHTDGLSNTDINQPSRNEHQHVHQHQSHNNADVRNCPICLLPLRSVSVMAVDGCNHGFHNDCISLWKNKTNTCPMCRTHFLFLRNRRRGIDVPCKTRDVSKYVEQQPCAQTNCGLLCENYAQSVICNTCHRCFHKACIVDGKSCTSDLILQRRGLTANAFVCKLCRGKCSDCGTTEDADGLLTCDRCTRRYCTCCAEWNRSDADFFCPECLPLMKKQKKHAAPRRGRRRRSARSRNVSRADADADDADGDVADADGDSANANGDSAVDDDADIQVNDEKQDDDDADADGDSANADEDVADADGDAAADDDAGIQANDEKADDGDNGDHDHDRNENEEANVSFYIDPRRLRSLNPVVSHAKNAPITPTPPNFSPITNCLRRKQNHDNQNHNHNHNGNHMYIDGELILLSDDEQDNDQSIKREAACNAVLPPWVQPGKLLTLDMIGGGVLTKILLVDECYVIVKPVKECAPTRFHNQIYKILRNEIDCLQPERESRLKLEPIDEDGEDECDHLNLQAPVISNNTDVHRSSHHGRDHVVPYREKNSSNQHEGGDDDNEPFAPALQRRKIRHGRGRGHRNSKTNATSSKQERDSDDDVEDGVDDHDHDDDVDDNVDDNVDEDIDVDIQMGDSDEKSVSEAASTSAAATAKRKRTATSKPKPKPKSKLKKQKQKKETYVCDECDFETPSRSNLTKHQRIHSGEKPFVCHVYMCGKAFSQKGNLQRHMRVHSPERPYPCTQCNKAFKRKDKLDLHLRVHSGQKPFACSQCDYKTGDASNLQRHRKMHAREAAAAASASGKKYVFEDI